MLFHLIYSLTEYLVFLCAITATRSNLADLAEAVWNWCQIYRSWVTRVRFWGEYKNRISISCRADTSCLRNAQRNGKSRDLVIVLTNSYILFARRIWKERNPYKATYRQHSCVQQVIWMITTDQIFHGNISLFCFLRILNKDAQSNIANLQDRTETFLKTSKLLVCWLSTWRGRVVEVVTTWKRASLW